MSQLLVPLADEVAQYVVKVADSTGNPLPRLSSNNLTSADVLWLLPPNFGMTSVAPFGYSLMRNFSSHQGVPLGCAQLQMLKTSH